MNTAEQHEGLQRKASVQKSSGINLRNKSSGENPQENELCACPSYTADRRQIINGMSGVHACMRRLAAENRM